MIADVNVEFYDSYGNDYTETLEVYIDDNESEENVEVIIEDSVNNWFLKTAETIFSTIVSRTANNWEQLFEDYIDNAELHSDIY